MVIVIVVAVGGFVILYVSLGPGLLRTHSESMQSHKPLTVVERSVPCDLFDEKASAFATMSENFQMFDYDRGLSFHLLHQAEEDNL